MAYHLNLVRTQIASRCSGRNGCSEGCYRRHLNESQTSPRWERAARCTSLRKMHANDSWHALFLRQFCLNFASFPPPLRPRHVAAAPWTDFARSTLGPDCAQGEVTMRPRFLYPRNNFRIPRVAYSLHANIQRAQQHMHIRTCDWHRACGAAQRARRCSLCAVLPALAWLCAASMLCATSLEVRGVFFEHATATFVTPRVPAT